MSYKNEAFDRISGNPMSYQIQWDCYTVPEDTTCKQSEFKAWSEVRNYITSVSNNNNNLFATQSILFIRAELVSRG